MSINRNRKSTIASQEAAARAAAHITPVRALDGAVIANVQGYAGTHQLFYPPYLTSDEIKRRAEIAARHGFLVVGYDHDGKHFTSDGIFDIKFHGQNFPGIMIDAHAPTLTPEDANALNKRLGEIHALNEKPLPRDKMGALLFQHFGEMIRQHEAKARHAGGKQHPRDRG